MLYSGLIAFLDRDQWRSEPCGLDGTIETYSMLLVADGDHCADPRMIAPWEIIINK